MDERVALDDGPELERLKTRVDGGAFRRPPVLPIVAVIGLFAGLALGVGFVPKPAEPTPVPSIAETSTARTVSPAPVIAESTASPTVWHAPTLLAAATSSPPKNGTTTAQAVASATKTFGIKSQDVLSIRLVDGTTYSPSVVGWVWEIVVRGPGPVQCGSKFIYPKPRPSYSPEPIYCNDDAEIVIVDFKSGEAVLMGNL